MCSSVRDLVIKVNSYVMSSAVFADLMLLLWDGHVHGTTSLLLLHSSSQDADLWVFDLVRLTDDTSSYRKVFQYAVLTNSHVLNHFIRKMRVSSTTIWPYGWKKGFLPLLDYFSLFCFFLIKRKRISNQLTCKKKGPTEVDGEMATRRKR